MTVLTDIALNCELDAEVLADLYLENPNGLDTPDARARFLTDRFALNHWDRPRWITVRDRSRSFIGVGR